MRRSGFSLIELLVAIAIIAALASLILPSVHNARESARKTHCQNNLRQIALALLNYHDQHKSFPLGGWGHEWIGVPERGHGANQPGGWVYRLLPNLEQIALFELPVGGYINGQPITAIPLSVFTCPSRRATGSWSISDKASYARSPKPGGSSDVAARGDYAINGGTSGVLSFPGPKDFAEGDGKKFDWALTDDVAGKFTGISHVRLARRLVEVEDGASATYLAGEKHLDSNRYYNGEDYGDNDSLYVGYSMDNHRFARMDLTPLQDGPDQTNSATYMRFGSAHSAGMFMANCDGSVHLVAYDVEPSVHYRSANASDSGAPLP